MTNHNLKLQPLKNLREQYSSAAGTHAELL